MSAVRTFVSGKVQGVYFRESMRQEAERLGVNGWCRNLTDGRVEAVLGGSESAVNALLDWCAHGPPAAQVQGVETEPIEPLPPQDAGFSVRR